MIQVTDPLVYFQGTDQTLSWGPVIIGSTFGGAQTPVTDCTGTATLLDQNGNPVTGANAIAAAGGTGGIYTFAIVGSAFNPSPGNFYKTLIKLSSPGLTAIAQWLVNSTVAPAGPR
jgi:hypothetical protein